MKTKKLLYNSVLIVLKNIDIKIQKLYNLIGDTMKKGFTLIELLAVILIIAIIAIITTPIVNNAIKNSKEKTFKNSVQEMINITKMDYNEYARSTTVTYKYENENLYCDKCGLNNENVELDYNGVLEATGSITIDENGNIDDVNIENEKFSATWVNKKLQVIKNQE